MKQMRVWVSKARDNLGQQTATGREAWFTLELYDRQQHKLWSRHMDTPNANLPGVSPAPQERLVRQRLVQTLSDDERELKPRAKAYVRRLDEILKSHRLKIGEARWKIFG